MWLEESVYQTLYKGAVQHPCRQGIRSLPLIVLSPLLIPLSIPFISPWARPFPEELNKLRGAVEPPLLISQQKVPVDRTALGIGMVLLRCSHGKKWNRNWSKMSFWTVESSLLKNDLSNLLQREGDCTFLKSNQLPPQFTHSLLRLYAPNGLFALPCSHIGCEFWLL